MFADALVIPQLYCKRIGAASGLSALPLKFSQGDFELLDDVRYVAFICTRTAYADIGLFRQALCRLAGFSQMEGALKDEEDHEHYADKGSNESSRNRPWRLVMVDVFFTMVVYWRDSHCVPLWPGSVVFLSRGR